ncbi:MAG: rod shape-determining protein MreD [Candidatus Brocadiia bacterium]
MIRKVRLAACIAALLLLQLSVAPRFSYRFLRPDLLLLAAAFVALEADFAGAVWAAFALGLLRDFASVGPLGAGPLLMVPAAAGLNALKEQLLRDSAWTDLTLTAAYVAVVGLAYATGTALLTPGRLSDLIPAALGQTAFTTALAPLLFPLLDKSGIVHPEPSP